MELAKRKNAVIKITGACTLSKEPPAERAMLMGVACAKAYGWSPKKG